MAVREKPRQSPITLKDIQSLLPFLNKHGVDLRIEVCTDRRIFKIIISIPADWTVEHAELVFVKVVRDGMTKIDKKYEEVVQDEKG